MKIVKDELESEHVTISDSRTDLSHWIEIRSVPYLRSRLEQMGLVEDKKDRSFPAAIQKQYLDHFIRGFFDAKAYVDENRVVINFNLPFLEVLYSRLVRHAGVKPERRIASTELAFSKEDSTKIRDFIYRDRAYIRSRGLYLPLKRVLFDQIQPPHNDIRINRIQRIRKASRLLPNKTVGEVREMVGYKSSNAFSMDFKLETGMTPREFKKRTRK